MHAGLANQCYRPTQPLLPTGEEGFEPPTFGFGNHCSTIRTILLKLAHKNSPLFIVKFSNYTEHSFKFINYIKINGLT